MSIADDQVLSEFLEAYGQPERPLVYGNPNHCEECFEANEILMDRRPEDLDPEELEEPSKSWFFSQMGADGWRHFLPGFVRVALRHPNRWFYLLLAQINPDYLPVLSGTQRKALFDVLDYGRACGYASDDWMRKELRQALRQIGTEPVEAGQPATRPVSK